MIGDKMWKLANWEEIKINKPNATTLTHFATTLTHFSWSFHSPGKQKNTKANFESQIFIYF